LSLAEKTQANAMKYLQFTNFFFFGIHMAAALFLLPYNYTAKINKQKKNEFLYEKPRCFLN
jgi:hypothetical protein